MNGAHHTAGQDCPLCLLKLKQAHPYLGEWFLALKRKYVNVHVSWSFRNQEEQTQCFKDGKTKLQWPYSPHNNMNASNEPFALALDLFQEDEDGVARWSQPFFMKVNEENVAAGEPIAWGGRFKTLADLDHFQFNGKIAGIT